MTPADRAKRLAERIAKQVKRAAGRGIGAAAIFVAARWKETVNVPAPKRRVVAGPRAKHPGEVYYVATQKATPGAPIRKLSGTAQKSIYSTRVNDAKAVVGMNARSMPTTKNPTGFNYPLHHEEHDHPHLAPTIKRWRAEVRKIIYAELRKP